MAIGTQITTLSELTALKKHGFFVVVLRGSSTTSHISWDRQARPATQKEERERECDSKKSLYKLLLAFTYFLLIEIITIKNKLSNAVNKCVFL